MANKLVDAGLKLASSPISSSKYATEWLDRTIYYTTYVTDAEGKVLVDGNGDEIVRNQALYLAGSFISSAEMKNAEAIEKEFMELNKLLRKKMESQGIKWRLKKTDQKALQIQGVTGL